MINGVFDEFWKITHLSINQLTIYQNKSFLQYLVQLMTCWLTAKYHYVNQCGHIVSYEFHKNVFSKQFCFAVTVNQRWKSAFFMRTNEEI